MCAHRNDLHIFLVQKCSPIFRTFFHSAMFQIHLKNSSNDFQIATFCALKCTTSKYAIRNRPKCLMNFNLRKYILRTPNIHRQDTTPPYIDDAPGELVSSFPFKSDRQRESERARKESEKSGGGNEINVRITIYVAALGCEERVERGFATERNEWANWFWCVCVVLYVFRWKNKLEWKLMPNKRTKQQQTNVWAEERENNNVENEWIRKCNSEFKHKHF